MEIINFLINEVFVEAPIFLGLIALIGLVVQKKPAVKVLEGTVKTIVGIIILNSGINVFLTSLLPLTSGLNKAFGTKGILPDCFGPFGVAMKTFSREISLTFILAFLIHVFLVRIIPKKTFKNVFLTGHIMLFQSTWFILAIKSTLGLSGYSLIGLSAVFTGILWTVLPAMARPFTKNVTNDMYTLGHLNTLAVIIPDLIGRKFKGTKKCSDLELPGFLKVFSDYTVLLAFIMPIMYISIGLIAGREAIEALSQGKNWIIWLTMSGLTFTAGVAIVLSGVRLFLSSMLPAFKGISDKLLPGAIAALDDPVFYPISPVATIIGFLSNFVFSVLITLLLIIFKAPIIILPGPIFFFFDGALAGIFGDRVGGWKGAAVGGALMGIIVQLGTILLVQFQPDIVSSGLAFSGPDMILLLPIFYIFKLIAGMMGIAV